MKAISFEAILRAVANLPELQVLVNSLDQVSVGDVYKTVFPNGIIAAFNEQILKRFGVTNETVANETEIETNSDTVYDRITDELHEEPVTDDYINDQFDDDNTIEFNNSSGNATSVVEDPEESVKPSNTNQHVYINSETILKDWIQKLMG